MEKTKHSLFMRSAGIMLGATMLMTGVLGGTLANYESSGTVTASATAAKWSIKVNNTDITESAPVTLDSINVYELGGTLADNEVKESTLAPGTWGYGTLDIENASDVAAAINANWAKGSVPAGMTVALLAEEPSTESDITEEVTSLDIASIDQSGTDQLYVAFKWDLGTNGDNNNDAGKSIDFGTLTIKATQKD